MLIPILIAYLAILATLVVWVRRRHGAQGEGRAFFVAGGTLSGFTTACSLAATSVGGSSTLITSALVYRYGLAGIWYDLAGTLGLVLLGLFVARRVRESGVSSIAELAGRTHGEAVRRIIATLVVVSEVAWLALLTKTTAALLAPALPAVGEPALLIATALVVVLYTLMGGQYVVSYSDIVQLGLMTLGLWIVAPVFLASALHSRNVAWSTLAWDFPTSATFGGSQIGAAFALMGLPHLVGPDVYAKLLSARDRRAAAYGALGAATLKLAFALAIAFIGLAGRALLPHLARDEALLGTLVSQTLPGTLGALVLVALTAAMMSSADQVFLSAITMIDHDLTHGRLRHLRPLTAFGVAGLAIGLALAAPTVIDTMKIAYTLFAAGLALPILFSVLWPKQPLARPWLIAALIAGASLGGTLHIARLTGAFHYQPVLWGLALNATLLAIAAARGKRVLSARPPPL